MTQIFSHHKLAVIGVAILIAFGVWYGLSSSPASPELITTPVNDVSSPIEQNLITTLLTFRAVSLDPAFLTTPQFMSLRDFSTQIVPEPVGRENPFAPLSTVGSNPSGTTTNPKIFRTQ